MLFFLFVFTDEPDNVSLISNISGSEACLGDVVSFTCTTDSNPAVQSYMLYENLTPVSETSSGRWLRELSVRRDLNYSCMANNSLGSGASEFLVLTVHGKSHWTCIRCFNLETIYCIYV